MKKDPPATPADAGQARPAAERLDGWKEIAVYLKREVRTVQRWEKTERLPVYRHVHERTGTVYAYRNEIDAWWNNRRPRLEQQEQAARAAWPRRLPWLATAAAILVAAAGLALWRYLAPPAAQQKVPGAREATMVVRRVWADPGMVIWGWGTVSRDGRYMSYTHPGTGDLAVRDFATGQTRRVTSKGSWSASKEFAGSSAISPDGKQIACAWFNRDMFYDLRLIPLEAKPGGPAPRILYRNEEVFSIGVAEWSPDGAHILALVFRKEDRTSRVVLASVADGSVRVLKEAGSEPIGSMSFSPDGRYIAYDAPQAEGAREFDIFVLAADGTGREIPVVQHPADEVLLGWAPDGDKILFASDRTGTIDAWAVPVGEGKARGAPVLVKKDIGPVRPIGFTRDGSYYYGLEAGMQDVYVAALDLTAGTLLSAPTRAGHRTVGTSSCPDWSPSGESLAYLPRAAAGHWSDRRSIVIRSLKAGVERSVSAQLTDLSEPRWFSDGRSLLVAGADFRGRSGLYRVSARSGDSTLLVQTRDARETFRSGACSPDGTTVFYLRAVAAAEPSCLLARNLETGQENELHSAAYRFALSPEGRSVAVITADPRSGLSSLMILPSTGGEARTLLSLGLKELIWSDLTWTPDGRALLFTRFKNTPQGRTTVLWRISADGGEPQPLPLEMAGLRDVRVHPDGRQVAFTAGQWATEVWAIDNLLLR